MLVVEQHPGNQKPAENKEYIDTEESTGWCQEIRREEKECYVKVHHHKTGEAAEAVRPVTCVIGRPSTMALAYLFKADSAGFVSLVFNRMAVSKVSRQVKDPVDWYVFTMLILPRRFR